MARVARRLSVSSILSVLAQASNCRSPAPRFVLLGPPVAMTGSYGGLLGGAGGKHRPLTSRAEGPGGGRTANFPGFGYNRGHPGNGRCPNPATYQTTRQLGHDFELMRTTQYRNTTTMYLQKASLNQSRSLPSLTATGRLTGGNTYAEMQATRLSYGPPISPW